jgi:hypothetical protein|tara:strand:- start:269 stop:448 length:180 start_codon:yes stop_codon:yes gene_type:complete
MRIFLTEFTYKGQTHDGPDIIAETREIAEKTAKRKGVTVIGELDSLLAIEDDNIEVSMH